MDNVVKPSYEFGCFHLDAQQNLIFKNGRRVKLSATRVEVLTYLIENRADLVKKETLLEKFWPSPDAAESNLTEAIYRIRQALGDKAKISEYIFNLSGVGYKFIAPVTVIEPAAIPIAGPETLTLEPAGTTSDLQGSPDARLVVEHSEEIIETTDIRATPQTLLRQIVAPIALLIKAYPKTTAAVAAVGFLGLSLGGWLLAGHSRNTNIHRAPTLTTLLNTRINPGLVLQHGQISHNGTMIAYTNPKDDQSEILVKQASNSKPVRVTENGLNNRCPIWSPDDQYLAFVALIDNQNAVWTVQALGSAPTLVTTLPFDPKKPGTFFLRKWSTIHPTKIYYEYFHNLFQLDIVTHEIAQITHFDMLKDQPAEFAVSADERMIAYTQVTHRNPAIFTSSLDGSSPSRLSDDNVGNGKPQWLPDGKRVIYSSRRDDTYQLVCTRIDDLTTEQLTSDHSDHFVTNLSSDGKKVLDITRKDESHLWGVDVRSHEESIYTREGGLQLWPETSINTSLVVFQITSSQDHILNSEVVAQKLPGSENPITLTQDGAFASVSPDNTKVAFVRLKNNVPNLWLVDVGGQVQRQLTTNGAAVMGYSQVPCNKDDRWDYSWSPDSKEIIFETFRSNIFNLSKISVNTGIETQITNNSDPTVILRSPLPSPNGTKLAYVSVVRLGRGLTRWSILIKTGDHVSEIYQSDKSLRLLGWSKSSDAIIFASDEKPGDHTSVPTDVGLNIIPIESKARRLVTTINSAYLIDAALSPDRQNVVVVCKHDQKDNLWVASLTDGSIQMITGNIDPTLYLIWPCWSADGHHIFFSKQESLNIISLIDNLF